MKTYRVWFSPEDCTEIDAKSNAVMSEFDSPVVCFFRDTVRVASFRYAAILGWEVVSEEESN